MGATMYQITCLLNIFIFVYVKIIHLVCRRSFNTVVKETMNDEPSVCLVSRNMIEASMLWSPRGMCLTVLSEGWLFGVCTCRAGQGHTALTACKLNSVGAGPIYIQAVNVVITVPTDVLAPAGARPSAGTVLTENLIWCPWCFAGFKRFQDPSMDQWNQPKWPQKFSEIPSAILNEII